MASATIRDRLGCLLAGVVLGGGSPATWRAGRGARGGSGEGTAGLAGAAGPDAAGRGAAGPDAAGFPGAAGSRGLAWPPRSLPAEDTIRLPVTFAVSARGPFP
jgi:hypothetical protein